MGYDIIFSGLICGLGLLVSGTYFLGRLPAQAQRDGWWTRLDTAEGTSQRQHRRGLGMAIVATVSLATFAGTNLINPVRFPLHFSAYWLCIAALLVWLCGLALVDILHTRRLLGRWRAQRAGAVPQDRAVGWIKAPGAARDKVGP